MTHEELRLTPEEIEKLLDKWASIDMACMAEGTDKPSQIEIILDILDKQISKLLSLVDTDENLAEEIENYIKYYETMEQDWYKEVTSHVLALFTLSKLKAVEQARKEERERIRPYIEDAIEVASNAQGEYLGIDKTYTPFWTHGYKGIIELMGQSLKKEEVSNDKQ